jgi:hypothetical protein
MTIGTLLAATTPSLRFGFCFRSYLCRHCLFVKPHVEILIIHLQLSLQLSCILPCSCLCSLIRSIYQPSWRGQSACDTVDNQRRHGAKVAGFGSLDLKPDRCVTL